MASQSPLIRAGVVGLGMIFEETYRPLFEAFQSEPLYSRATGAVAVELKAVASLTGVRATQLKQHWAGRGMPPFESFEGPTAVHGLLGAVDVVCVATPDDRHFEIALGSLQAGKHVLIEKPSVLFLDQLDRLEEAARANRVVCKVVYHKLLDPDHKKLRTLYQAGTLQHVNNGYCSLLEPKSISIGQFAPWIAGRNPGTYVAVHYLKLIDFSFGKDWRLKRIAATGQRGIVGPVDGPTWDSVQLQVVYEHPDRREAAFDIHTNWVTPDNFTGYVEQEVQFRFDNALWLAHQRKRGVEVTVEGKTPLEMKNTPNHHYNGSFLEPWDERSQRGYGIETLRRFFEEVSFVEFGGPTEQRSDRLSIINGLAYNDISADRNCVAIVQAMEAILAKASRGEPGARVEVNSELGGLVLLPRHGEAEVLYANEI